ncbi:MAG: DUF998 domain-containing protein [Dehalococcoidia bacterium]
MAGSNDLNPLLVSFGDLRRGLGIMGIALPFVLALGNLIIFQEGLQTSISDYYHTDMGDVLVGTLCAVGVFLAAYQGYTRRENLISYLTGVFAIGVALFPTTPAGATTFQQNIGIVHLIFAALLFLSFAYFALRVFTQGDTSVARKRRRNKVYIVSGIAILLCILLIIIANVVLDESQKEAYKPVFWLEAIAIVFFGISWLVKGTALPLLRD